MVSSSSRLALVVLAAVLCSAAAMSFKPTPLGPRPAQCVHQVPAGSHIEQVEGGVNVVAPNGEKEFLPELPECMEDIRTRVAFMQAVRSKVDGVNVTATTPRPMSALGWLDYVDYTLQTGQVLERFTSDYTVPGNPATDGSQVLFYFIGTENIRSTTDLSILQPVLTWGNGINGWSYASWNCCPSGQHHESAPITGFGAGDQLFGEILDDGTNWSVMSEYNGKNATLTVASAGRHFDWLDVTLEVYNVAGCDEFAKGPMTFDNMKVTTPTGGSITPEWSPASGTTQCNGVTKVENPSTVTITHGSN